MTDEQRADASGVRQHLEWLAAHENPDVRWHIGALDARAILDAIEAAVLAEREACALVAEGDVYVRHWESPGEQIAAAIRARGGQR